MNPMNDIIETGLRNASIKQLIDEIKRRDLYLGEAQKLVNYLYPLQRWSEDE